MVTRYNSKIVCLCVEIDIYVPYHDVTIGVGRLVKFIALRFLLQQCFLLN